MELIEQMHAFVKAYKKAERTLDELDVRADDVRSRYDSIRAERESLEQKIADDNEAMTQLEQEDSEVKHELLEAVLSDDVSEQRQLKEHRKGIERRLGQHQSDIRSLREKLEALSTDSVEAEAATVAMEVERVIAEMPFIAEGELYRPTNLCRNELESRADSIKSNLPAYTDEVRRQVDTAYREQQEDREARLARAEALRKEEEAKARQTVRAVADDEGIIQGFNVFDESGELIRFAPVKRVAITQ